MSSYGMPYRPRRKALLPRVRRFANRAAMLAQAVTARDVATQRRAGRPPKSLYSGTKMTGGSSTSTAQGVSTQTGGSRTITSDRVKKTKAIVKMTPKRLQVKSVDQMVRANTRTIKQVFQVMNEIDQGFGGFNLRNTVGAQCPLRAFCLTTIDRPNADIGDHYPSFNMLRDSTFVKDTALPVVFGNQTDKSGDLGLSGRLVMASARIKLLLWARDTKSTTYDISIIRFKGNSQHLAPYVTPEEQLSLSALSTDQLSERKAFWIDHMLRHLTVNPVALSKDGLSRMRKHYEVLYHKEVTIDEKHGDEDENDRHFEQINLPINCVKNFNYSVNSRYDDNTDEVRIDQPINTSTNDLVDTKTYHKCSLNSNIWLIIKANNATTASAEGGGGEVTPVPSNGTSLPTFDLSFECKYKTFSTQ
jgi:hypothetical protein